MIGTADLVQVRRGLDYSNKDYYGYILPIVKRIKYGDVDNIITLIQTVKEQGLLDYRKVAESLDIVLD
jgi:hypothetical protein